MKNVLEADSIVVSYNNRLVLTSVYIRCQQGEIVGLLGRNGSGKSTLLKTIFGILQPDHKSVRINGMWIANGYSQSNVTLLPQFGMIPSNLRIVEAMRLFDIDVSRIKTFAPDKLLLIDRKPSQLSGGELRFVELLLILFSNSRFSLLDEPFSGLSPVMIERAIEIMNEVKKEKGLLITDHMYRYVTSCAERLYCMYNGSVVEIKGPDDLIHYGYLNADE